MRRQLLALGTAGLLATTAACGTTVPLTSQAASGQLTGDGLAQPTAGPGGPSASTGPLNGGSLGTTTSTGTRSGTTSSNPSAVPGGQVGIPTQAASGVRVGAPIKIGFITTSVGNAAALGVNAGQSYSDQSMWQAMVDEYNAHGGLAGHKIQPVYGATDTASSDWEGQFAKVCAQFTQDNHVRAVIGYIFVFLPSFETCLAKAGIPHLYGGYQPGDQVDQQQYPTLVSTGHPTVDGFFSAVLDGGWRTGLLNTSTKLGVLLSTCANGDRAYKNTIEPWLKAHAINYQTVIANCAQGSSDVSSAANAVSNAELKFAASGVKLVLATDVALLLFMIDAQSQGYSPTYLTGVGGAALEPNAPSSQLKKMHGFGWMPAVDVNPSHQPYPRTAAQVACVSKLAKHGLHAQQYNDFMAAYQACDGLELYAKALADGSVSAPSVVRSVEAALPAFRGAGSYGGVLHAVPGQRGGAAVMREYAWTDGCSCFTYRGPTYPIPTP